MPEPIATRSDFLNSDPDEWPLKACDVCGEMVHWPPFRTRGEVICHSCMEQQDPYMGRELPDLTSRGRLERAGCPARYLELTRATWEQRYMAWDKGRLSTAHGDGREEEQMTVAELLGHWRDDDPTDNWLVFLYGAHGRGKTGLATSLLGELIEGRSIIWLDAEDWVDRMQEEFHGGNWMPLYRQACDTDVLLLDDVASVRGDRIEASGGNWGAERIALVLRSRERNLKHTIVTSNMEAPSDMGAINPSLVSRIQSCRLVFKIAGPDRRRTP